MLEVDILIIGGGIAGLAAAISTQEKEIKNVLILEREGELGGILNQCIHNGFGKETLVEEVTGTEFAQRFVDKVRALNINFKLNTTVLELMDDKTIIAVNEIEGIIKIKAKAVILATGCREMPWFKLNIFAKRIAGIFTSGTAQKFINIQGYLPGKEVVIMGTSDRSLILARRLTLEGASVKAVIEINSNPLGQSKNISDCIEAFNIPLLLNTRIADIRGKNRVKGVTISSLDENRKSIVGSVRLISCDTVIIPSRLQPENELLKKAEIKMSEVNGSPLVNNMYETNLRGVFACGNLLYGHENLGSKLEECEISGKAAALYVKGMF